MSGAKSVCHHEPAEEMETFSDTFDAFILSSKEHQTIALTASKVSLKVSISSAGS
jgi:hypothetical protein